MTRADEIRERKRKRIETPDGPFLIRKVTVQDHIDAGRLLPDDIYDLEIEERTAILKTLFKENPGILREYNEMVLVAVTIETPDTPKVVASNGSLDGTNHICIMDLDSETVRLLVDAALSFEPGDAPKSDAGADPGAENVSGPIPSVD